MIKPTGVLSLIGLIALGASLGAGDAAAAPQRQAFSQVNGVWQRHEHGCGTPQGRVSSSLLPPAPAVGLRTVYLNKNGGTYTLGTSTDASANRANRDIIPGTGAASFTIPPLNTAVFNWTLISQCVRRHFMRFNVQIVEAEPTGGDYIEAVVGGTGEEAGFVPNDLFGIASADNFCNVNERGIAFNFSETHRNVPRRDDELCATIAHEVGHIIALEHEGLATDLMSYVLIDDSGTKAFVDQLSNCGPYPHSMNNCSCGSSSTQTSSFARLRQFIGLRDLETVPPTLNVDAPGGAVVPPTFDVVVTATDNAMMGDVVVLIDNVEVGNDLVPEESVYRIAVKGVPEGPHTLSAVARDAAGNTTRKDLDITVRRSATGESCTASDACAGGICAQAPDGNFCTQACDLANDTCPSGFECAAVGAATVCIASDDGGCGCASGRRGAGPMLLLALALGALVLRRRRR